MVSSLVPNDHVLEVMLIPTSYMEKSSDDPRKNTCSHAKMVVLGSNYFVLESTGRTSNIQPFRSDLGLARNVLIVDSALTHDCPWAGEVHVLVIRNSLRVPSMCNNLILPFIMRSGGITMNDVPKTHCEDPAVDDHCMLFDQSDLWTSLKLNKLFSNFHMRVPAERELHECEKLFVNPN